MLRSNLAKILTTACPFWGARGQNFGGAKTYLGPPTQIFGGAMAPLAPPVPPPLMHRPFMQYGMCCPCMRCEKFPAGLNSSESEEASRKRGLGRKFYLSTIPCDQATAVSCAWLNFPHRRLTFGIGFFGPGSACEASHILEKALELMVKRRSSN